jgi:hypothetical protein
MREKQKAPPLSGGSRVGLIHVRAYRSNALLDPLVIDVNPMKSMKVVAKMWEKQPFGVCFCFAILKKSLR